MDDEGELLIKGNILIVDDKLDNLKVLESTLKQQGYQVRKAINGSMALMGATAEPPDLILLDIKMPGMDGYQVCEQLKANSITKEIPVIFLSALDDVFNKVKAFEIGGVDYITKPFQTKEILVRVQNQLQIRHLQAQLQTQNQHLTELNQELIRSNQELEQFAHVVSHDLKQPLQVILGFTHFITKYERNNLKEKTLHFLDLIAKSGNQMKRLINDLLAFSQVGAATPELKHIDCNLVLEQVLENLQMAIAEQQATINYASLPTVAANETQLVELLQNLICNGIKFHSQGELPQIRISAQQKKDKWVFRVHDNGIGIEPEQFEAIFQMFQRLHSPQEYPGTGIGLATCKKIVEHHGGEIWVESELGKGTSFYFTIPVSICSNIV
ncbi:two-component hybrid histidine kinase [Calothrix parasitica NIES-267]|uniref:histidine kinase n=1 Tax=Calothrix parasitica NIES-267 TaxID=1973488 RepID=A0A1Z4LRB0_9CYAN|nr:two-component hybrid histidine kinase [Calothrix parasitica NIES-267]